MDAPALLGLAADAAVALTTEAADGESTGLVINLFWVIIAAVNFVVFLVLINALFFGNVSTMLRDRRERIEQGLRDADQARQDRERAEEERLATLQEARREANDILTRAQKVAQDQREADMAATREELDRVRERATSTIEAEKQRALGELRSEVADLALAAASKVVRETMTDQRQRRIVEEFLAEPVSTQERQG
jgi:F-type H+-transporting ATPase subunit b